MSQLMCVRNNNEHKVVNDEESKDNFVNVGDMFLLLNANMIMLIM